MSTERFSRVIHRLPELVTVTLIACSSSHAGSGTSGAASGGGPFGNASQQPSGSAGSAAGGAGMAANGAGASESCSSPGMTRTCCTKGTQTCIGQVEFATWSSCVDRNGTPLVCNPGGPIDAGAHCGQGEFAKYCDGGVPRPDSGMPELCKDESINNEPEILVGYAPASGEAVSANGQIKVWVNDEAAAIIAPGEQVDANTGEITMPGDRTAKAPDGYLWEPALYIAPETAESGGTPHFPQLIKGWYNNMMPPASGRPPRGLGVQVAGMDPPPAGTKLSEKYTTEYIWDVTSLGLSPGTYTGEFVIHDGDRDRAVGCVTIVITK